MASAIVEIVAPSGMTLTLSLFPIGSDTAGASGKTLTERTNCKGTYRATVTEVLVGLYRAVALSGTTAVAVGIVLMSDVASDHYVVPPAPTGMSTYAGDDTAGTTTLLARVVGTIATGTHNPQSGDGYLGATAKANLILAFDGTGYSAPTAPAQQQQVANIAVTGAALNATAASRTLSTGSETNAYTDTFTDDGVDHTITAAGNAIDIYYEFSLGSTGQAGTSVSWQGYVGGVVNAIKVYAYNWGGSSWDQIGTIAGITGTTEGEAEYDLTSAHTGTGGNLGKVRVRFANTGLTLGTLNTDRLLVGYTTVPTYQSGDAYAQLTTATPIDGKTIPQALQIIGAVVAGTITDAQTGTEIFHGLDGSTVRVTVTVDSSGNRSIIVYA
jgi:hypothetical protein